MRRRTFLGALCGAAAGRSLATAQLSAVIESARR